MGSFFFLYRQDQYPRQGHSALKKNYDYAHHYGVLKATKLCENESRSACSK